MCIFGGGSHGRGSARASSVVTRLRLWALAESLSTTLTCLEPRARVVNQKGTMRWYHYLAYFFGGMFLANAVPHLVSGTLGRQLQTPFASPPGVGLSSAVINVLWGFFNLAVAYVLVGRVGRFDFRNTRQVVALGAGLLAMSIMLARTFARLHGGL